MPADELAEGALRLLGRFLWQLLVELLFEGVCHRLGLFSLQVLSAGRYPPTPRAFRHDLLCAGIGLLEIVALAVALLHLFGES